MEANAKKETSMSAVAARKKPAAKKPATKKAPVEQVDANDAPDTTKEELATATKATREQKREALLVEKETLLLDYLHADPERGYRGDGTGKSDLEKFMAKNEISGGMMGALAARRAMPGRQGGSKLTIGKRKGKSKWGHADHVGLDA